MTFGKCFINWIKEAGRGHLCAFAGWGTMFVYGVLLITRLSFNTDYTYFGVGSVELIWVCVGLGLFLGFSGIFLSVAAKETGFLLQPAGEKRCNFLEQVCSRARTIPCAIPSCHGGVRCLSGVAGHGLRTFYRELYSQEHAQFLQGCS